MNTHYSITVHDQSYTIEIEGTGRIAINGEIVTIVDSFVFDTPERFDAIHFPNFLTSLAQTYPIHYALLSCLKEDNPSTLVSRYTEIWDSVIESCVLALLKRYNALPLTYDEDIQFDDCYVYDFYEDDFLVQFHHQEHPVFFNKDGIYIAGNHPGAYAMERSIGGVLKAWLNYVGSHTMNVNHSLEDLTLQLSNYVLAHPEAAAVIIEQLAWHKSLMLDVDISVLCRPLLQTTQENLILL